MGRAIAYPDPPLRDGPVLLRPFRDGDVPVIVAAVQDPLVKRFNTSIPNPYTERDARAWLSTHAAALRAGLELNLAITVDGALVGAVGLGRLEMAQRRGEVGYWVAAGARGRGYATSALRLLGDWALAPDGLGLARLQLTADVENAASQRCAAAGGFTREGVLHGFVEHQGARRDMVVWARLAPPQ